MVRLLENDFTKSITEQLCNIYNKNQQALHQKSLIRQIINFCGIDDVSIETLNVSCKDLTVQIEHESIESQKEEKPTKIKQILDNYLLSCTERVNLLSMELNSF